MNAEEYFEEHHVPRHSKLIKGCGLLYQESEIPKLMEAYHQEQVKKLNIDDVGKCECGETKDLITVCEDCTYKMVSEGN